MDPRRWATSLPLAGHGGYDIARRNDQLAHGGSNIFQRQTFILRCLSLSLASISLVSAILAFYWFLRMRRTFRHDLIMLLIQSDFVKALFFLIFPIVDFVSGPIASDSTFCQVSGFFLTVGIEACDVAILLITLHGALYIFQPKRPGGQSGLYPYRRFAYAIYITFPVLMAGLAFTRGKPAYQNTGEYCYLSVRDPWYRMYLSWIPRYVIFVLILVLSCAVYIYVTVLLVRYRRRSSRQLSTPEPPPPPPPTPPLVYNGLIPSPPVSRPASIQTAPPSAPDRPMSVGSMWSTPLIYPRRFSQQSGIPPKQGNADRRSIPNWNNWDFKSAGKKHLTDLGPSSGADTPSQSSQVERPTPVYQPSALRRASVPKNVFEHGDVPNSERQTTSYRTSSSAGPVLGNIVTSSTITDLITALRQGPSELGSSNDFSEVNLSPIVVGSTTDLARSRHRTQRQLKLLFVYPVVYIMTWIFPFVSHIMQYDDSLTSDGPFWLLALSLISLCTQGTVDCVLFMVREKPWRHVKGGFWESLRKRMSFRNWKGRIAGSGRTAEEMVIDGRSARVRRNQEIRQEDIKRMGRGNSIQPSPNSKIPYQSPRKGFTNWWDAEAGESDSEDEA